MLNCFFSKIYNFCPLLIFQKIENAKKSEKIHNVSQNKFNELFKKTIFLKHFGLNKPKIIQLNFFIGNIQSANLFELYKR